jgi:hypothetical protein
VMLLPVADAEGRVLLLPFGTRCTVAAWLLLLYPTAKCLGLGHSEHCGFSHGFSPYFPPLRGGVIWCIFMLMIS